MNRLLRSWTLLGVLALGGCGTIHNLTGDARIYGGVREDVNEMGNTGPCSVGFVLIFDLPFSFVLDTASLPFTLLYELFRPAAPVPREPAPSMPNPNAR